MLHPGLGLAGIQPCHRLIAPTLLALLLGGCAAVPLERASSLTSYDSLTSNNGRMTKANYRVAPTDLVSARTICGSRRSRYHHPHRADQYRGDRPVDGNVARSQLRRSGARPEAASRAWRSFRRGRGSHGDGKQVGAMVWAKGANFVTTNARVSQIGDAYSLAASFGSDFSKMLVRGKTPFKVSIRTCWKAEIRCLREIRPVARSGGLCSLSGRDAPLLDRQAASGTGSIDRGQGRKTTRECFISAGSHRGGNL
jgi:hypothetical protein